MANLLDFLNGKPTDTSLYLENERLRSDLDDAIMRVEEVEESLLEVADAFDNIGWSPMGFTEPQQINEIPLATVKKISEVSRALMVNPFVKNAVNARIGYVWGNGVEFENLDDATKKILKKNRDTLFSQQAYAERELAAATDGNVFTALHINDTSTFRVPLAQITGAISNPDNTEEIWYFKREWTTRKKSGNNADEAEREENNVRYYPSIKYAQRLEDEGKGLPKRWGKVGVDQFYVIQHTAVNKQIGWRWGVPDIMPAIFWAKAYKDYLSDNLTLVKAMSRIATQVKSGNQAAANSAAAQYRTTPNVNPITGETNAVGATAFTGLDVEVVPTGLNASGVDFSKGNPVAAGIASALGVSLDIVLGTSTNSGTGSTLDSPTLKTMETRQNLWTNAFTDLFEFWGEDDAKITWRNIDEDETHRRVQSVQLAYDGGLLHQEEARAETLQVLRITPTSTDMPVAPAIVAAEKAADQAEQTAIATAKATPTVVPGQGRSGTVGSVNSGKGQVKQAVKKSMNG